MKISGLALRRKIALAKGYTDIYVSPSGRPGTLVGKIRLGLRLNIPAWDSDPAAAFQLWAELVAKGFNGFPLMFHVDFEHRMDTLAFMVGGL